MIIQNPIISVIIPTYNRASLLQRSIESILNQTFRDLELIIVDDGSTDNTKELIDEFIKKDPRIRYIWKENSGGPAEPINIGIKNSKGKYITILGSDDEILPEKLEKQIKKFDSVPGNIGLIYCGLQYIPEIKNKQSKVLIPKLKGDLFIELLKNNFIAGITPLIKKECFQKFGYFDTSLPSGEEWDLWLRISREYKFDYVTEILAIYHIHGKQISANFNDTIEGFEKILEKYKGDIYRYPSIYNFHLIRLGIFYCLNNDINTGRKYFSKAIKVKPIQINAYLNLILSRFSNLYSFFLISFVKRFTFTGYFLDFKK